MLTKHHVVPKERGGKKGRENIMILPDKFHNAYHLLFGNLTPAEAQHFFKRVFLSKKRKWTGGELHRLRKVIEEK